jgi:hypothetical protein
VYVRVRSWGCGSLTKMTVFSKHNYEDQYDGRILKAGRKQQHIMFPAPIAFLNNELKAKVGMKTKKEEE